MFEIITKGSTSRNVLVTLRDSTTGLLKTGLAYTDVIIKYHRDGANNPSQAVGMQAGTVGSYATGGGGWVEVSGGGIYQFGIPDAALATGKSGVTFKITAAGVIDKEVRISLTDFNLQSASVVAATVTDVSNIVADVLDGTASQITPISTALNNIATGATIVRANDAAGGALATAANQTTTLIRIGTPAGASLSADVGAVKTDTGALATRITSTLFSGITSLGNWLRAFGRKSTPDATALTEINTGGGTYDATEDAQEAIRDHGDLAWVTGSGGGGAGDGDTDVDHNTGGADVLAYKTAGGAGIAGASVRAFLKTDYDAGTFTVRAEAKTDFNGRWTNKMRLFAGSTYTIEFGEAGEYGPDTVEVTV